MSMHDVSFKLLRIRRYVMNTGKSSVDIQNMYKDVNQRSLDFMLALACMHQ